jgi:hypothetical protein
VSKASWTSCLIQLILLTSITGSKGGISSSKSRRASISVSSSMHLDLNDFTRVEKPPYIETCQIQTCFEALSSFMEPTVSTGFSKKLKQMNLFQYQRCLIFFLEKCRRAVHHYIKKKQWERTHTTHPRPAKRQAPGSQTHTDTNSRQTPPDPLVLSIQAKGV